METLEITLNSDLTITVEGWFNEGEKGDNETPGIAPYFEVDEYSCDNEDDLGDFKTTFKSESGFISHLEDLCLKQLLA